MVYSKKSHTPTIANTTDKSPENKPKPKEEHWTNDWHNEWLKPPIEMDSNQGWTPLNMKTLKHQTPFKRLRKRRKLPR